MSSLQSPSGMGRVLWPATSLEEYFTVSHENHFDLTCYKLVVVTQHPLEEDHVALALKHLYRKVPSLRVCQGRGEDGQLLTCHMTEEKILLQVLDASNNWEDVYINETRKQHQVTTGPMWRVIVLPSSSVLDKQALEDGFPHQYHIMFGFHHAITDGHSSIRICGHFINLLNNVIEGNTIDDTVQLAEFVSRITEHARREALEYLESDSEAFNYYKKRIEENSKARPLLYNIFPYNNDPNPKTMNIFHDFNEELTQKFVSRAKTEGVTVHSAFCSVLHVVFVELLRKAGYENDTYDIQGLHDINYRRYAQGDSENKFGVHIGLHKYIISVNKDIMNVFWHNARLFHVQFHKEIKRKDPIIIATLEHKLNPMARTLMNSLKVINPLTAYYAISNIGNVTSFFKNCNGEEHKWARVCHLQRTTSVHTYMVPSTYCIQTLNGKLLCSYDYNTRYVSTETANKLMQKLIQVMDHLFK